MTQMLNVFQVMADRVAFVEEAGVEMGKHALVSDLSSSFSVNAVSFYFSIWNISIVGFHCTTHAIRVLHVISRQNLSNNALIIFSWFKVLLKQIASF